MATEDRKADLALKLEAVERMIRDDPCQFQFFQAVRILQQIAPDRVRVGEFARPEQESLRFGAHRAFPFPASEIQYIEWPEEGPAKMKVNFMGLTGPSGVLPLAYTEHLADRQLKKDRTMEEFFDLFHHRIISLFYRAWEKYRFPVRYESGQEDHFSEYLSAFVGLGSPGMANRQDVEDDSLRFYAGLVALQPRSAAALRGIIGDYFDVAAEVEQFVGSWREIDTSDQSAFRDEDDPAEMLGIGTMVGDAVWERQSRVRVRIGPLPRSRYQDFLPTGVAYKPLKALLRFFTNENFAVEVQLVLKREDVPVCRLDTDAGIQLGWVTWMKSTPGFNRDPGDTVLLFQEEN
jgi:type VI secretion system protein ImpH